MKNLIVSIVVFVVVLIATVFALNKYNSKDTSKNNTEQSQKEEKPIYITDVVPSELEKDYGLWRNYNTENIELSYEFTPIDENDNIIEKEEFLNQLKTGLYIPLQVKDKHITYKLHKLSETSDKKITRTIKSFSTIAYNYLKKEGEQLPTFHFTDLTGNQYSSESTKGKIMVIKCWFIHCVVCVQEFPELNELYDRYESNGNVLFLSLAFDKEDKLKKFLIKKEFRYPVVAEQKDYMTKKLALKQYPSHIIIDEEGNIVKIVNNVKALVTTLNKLTGNNNEFGDN